MGRWSHWVTHLSCFRLPSHLSLAHVTSGTADRNSRWSSRMIRFTFCIICATLSVPAQVYSRSTQFCCMTNPLLCCMSGMTNWRIFALLLKGLRSSQLNLDRSMAMMTTMATTMRMRMRTMRMRMSMVCALLIFVSSYIAAVCHADKTTDLRCINMNGHHRMYLFKQEGTYCRRWFLSEHW